MVGRPLPLLAQCIVMHHATCIVTGTQVRADGDVAYVSDDHTALRNRFPGIPDAQRTAVIDTSSRDWKNECEQVWSLMFLHHQSSLILSCCSHMLSTTDQRLAMLSPPKKSSVPLACHTHFLWAIAS